MENWRRVVKIATLFCGCGGATLGTIAATNGTPIWAIEFDPQIAQLYRNNISQNVIVDNLLNIDPRKLERPDILQISPPCQSHSMANANRGETENDRALAAKICEFIQVLNPQFIMIENVEGYRSSNSYQQLINQLDQSNYHWDWQILNSADFGVPQTRRRLIVRASKSPLPLIIPTHAKVPHNTLFNQQLPWVGWYEAVADILHTLPQCELANWQKQRMLDRDVPAYALIERSGARDMMQIRNVDRPSFTIRAMCGKIRPNFAQANILISGQQSADIRSADEPSVTILSGNAVNRILCASGGQGIPRCAQDPAFTVMANSLNKSRIIDDAICYRVTTPALSRLQSFPDWFDFGSDAKIIVKAIGNSVPPRFAQAIMKSFIARLGADLGQSIN